MAAQPASLLVVDDDALNCDMISRALQRKGYEVSIASGGELALELIQHHPFDLILLDVMMPGVNGLEVLQRIRQVHSSINLPIIMVTARGESEDIVKALNLGANDYVTKPLDFPVVTARIQTHLSVKYAAEQVIQLERSLAERNHELELTNARLEKVNHRMSRDLRAAARIQKTFLPQEGSPLPGISVAWIYLPCDELGGDGLNILPLDETRIAMYVLDVSGHGVASALLSVTVSRLLGPPHEASSILGEPSGKTDRWLLRAPSEVAEHLNRLFPFDLATGQFATLLYGILDLETGSFQYVSAGQPGPILVPSVGDPELLESPGYPIGLAEEPYELRQIQLGPRDRLILYSDGLPEAMNAHNEPFGSERLMSAIIRDRAISLSEGVNSLLADVERWRGTENVRDDLSILAVEVQPAFVGSHVSSTPDCDQVVPSGSNYAGMNGPRFGDIVGAAHNRATVSKNRQCVAVDFHAQKEAVVANLAHVG